MTDDIQNTPTPPKNLNPTDAPDVATPLPRRVTDLPNDMAAASMAKFAADIDPDHPAASLAKMNDKLLDLMVAEDDQACLLRRQSQTLDAMFHSFIKQGMDTDGRAYPSTIRHRGLTMALKTQRQCFDTVRALNSMEYMKAVATHLQNKPPEIPPYLLRGPSRSASETLNPPTPHFSNEQTKEGDY